MQTDTASVLHEAATCIKHLHGQIQVSQMLHCISFLLNCHATLVHETKSFESLLWLAGHGRGRWRCDGSAQARLVRGATVPGRRAARVYRGRAPPPRRGLHGGSLALPRHYVTDRRITMPCQFVDGRSTRHQTWHLRLLLVSSGLQLQR